MAKATKCEKCGKFWPSSTYQDLSHCCNAKIIEVELPEKPVISK
ncbi:MAG TPA: hypothetical protein VJB94_05305 [Candidatus Nanoarchaeia archaeon]|nr:hypothetical protein [Candidatus Nanoarchaeia archaeon]